MVSNTERELMFIQTEITTVDGGFMEKKKVKEHIFLSKQG